MKPSCQATLHSATSSSSSRTRRAVATFCVFLNAINVVLFSILVPSSSIPSSLQPPQLSGNNKYFKRTSSLPTPQNGRYSPTSIVIGQSALSGPHFFMENSRTMRGRQVWHRSECFSSLTTEPCHCVAVSCMPATPNSAVWQ